MPKETGLQAVVNNPAATVALLEDLAKRWLAHDGLWFQAVEKEYGLAAAIELDTAAWEKSTRAIDPRIKTRCLVCPLTNPPANPIAPGSFPSEQQPAGFPRGSPGGIRGKYRARRPS